MREATERAAIRRGCVWPISPETPRPSSKQILGNCVVLPEPVSPQTITTWLLAIAAEISSFLPLTGNSGGYSGVGKLAKRAANFCCDVRIFCVISLINRCAFASDFSSLSFWLSPASLNLRRSTKRSANMQLCKADSSVAYVKVIGLGFTD